jgi:Leucine-rich repeat (LRR) protein
MLISSNNLIGSVDLAHFRILSYLTVLDLSYNELHVMSSDNNDPADTSYLAGLNVLGLVSCNITQFPRFLRHVNRISHLDLSCNKISGDIPNWTWEMTWSVRGSYLNLSHNMFTGMQLNSDVVPINTRMEVLDLSFNRLSGTIPMPSSGTVLEYFNNMFSSLLPNWTSYLCQTTYFSISKNSINGHVSPSICNDAIMLDVLDLSYNYFSGLIPPCFMDLSILNLRENHFEGTLPSSIRTGCGLQTIDLHGNKIEGKLPRGLSNCLSLEVLDLGGNRIADTFPSWLRGLPKLSVMVLRSNQLYGTIGDIVGDTKFEECFPSLQIIDLASNNFSGNLRPQWFKR